MPRVVAEVQLVQQVLEELEEEVQPDLCLDQVVMAETVQDLEEVHHETVDQVVVMKLTALTVVQTKLEEEVLVLQELTLTPLEEIFTVTHILYHLPEVLVQVEVVLMVLEEQMMVQEEVEEAEALYSLSPKAT
jgi:hypothetical protein